jgi:hypothetical protein
MSTFDPIAPVEPDEFDPDAYEAMIDAIEEMTGKTSTVELEEAFNPNQARFPKGHERAGQWRPKLVTGAGRVAPGHLDRDLRNLTEHIADMQKVYGSNAPPQRVLNEIGTEVEKTALRYSARKVYEKRIEEIHAQRKAIQDRQWAAWEKAAVGMTPEEFQNADPKDMLTADERKTLVDLVDEEIRTRRQRDFADRDAMLGVLQKIRPMGGTLKQAKPTSAAPLAPIAIDVGSGIERKTIEERPGDSARKVLTRQLDESLKQILKVIPKAWLDDTNGKGDVSWLISADRAWALTTNDSAERPEDSFRQMEDTVDDALKGHLQPEHVHYAATDVMEAKGDPYPPGADPTTSEALAWRARRDAQESTMAKQRYTWVGRIQTGQPMYPRGLWAVVQGKDDKRHYYVDWGGNLHLLPGPQPPHPADEILKAVNSPVAHTTADVIPMPRDDRRFKGTMPLTRAQHDGIERTIANGGAYAGMYDGRYPVIRRPGTKEGGVGPYAAIYDWVDVDGAQKNLHELPPASRGAARSRFDEAKWDRAAPQPPAVTTSQNTVIKVDPSSKNTVLHELCHRLEVVYGTENKAGYNPISMATHAWLTQRTAGEDLQRLKDLYPNTDYEENEYARPDKFVDAYIGKAYGGQATEVLTMGMEMLWFPRYGERDINKDPEMRRLILGLQATL